MRALRNLAAVVLAGCLLSCSVTLFSLSGCKQLDKADNIVTDPKTGAVTQTPGPSTVTAVAAGAGMIPVYGNYIQAAILIAGAAYAKYRLDQSKGKVAATLAAAVSTAQGVGAIVPTLSPEIQAKFATAINVAHDAAGVAQALQDHLQSVATGHPAAVAGAPVPAAVTAT